MNRKYESKSDCYGLYNESLITEKRELTRELKDFSEDDAMAMSFILKDVPYTYGYENPYTHVFFVRNGKVRIDINNKVSTILGANYFIFINLHSEISIKPMVKNTDYFAFNFKREFFHPDFMKRLSVFSKFYSFINYCLMNNDDDRTHMIYKYDDDNALRILYMLMSFIENNETRLIESGLLYLFEILSNAKASEIVASLSIVMDFSTINKMKKYIVENFTTVTLESLAREFSYHPNYLSNMIKKETGKTFQTHVQEAKLEYAKYLLLNTDSYIKNISYDIGYTDTSYFNKVFKKYYGCTPNEYRKLNLDN